MSILVASFKDTKLIAAKVARALNAELTILKERIFPDGEYNIIFKKTPRHREVIVISSMADEPNKKIIETILAGGVAKDNKAKKIILVATYLPYMRQDSHFINFDGISSRHIVELFSDFDKIIAIEPHLHRIHSIRQLSNKSESLSVNELIADYIKRRFKDDFTIVGPDEESAQWSQKIASLLGKKVIILNKKRLSPQKVKIKKRPLGKNIIIIDDIISTGHTLLETIRIAKRYGAKKIICIGIHGIFAKNSDRMLSKHAEIITTNTIPNKKAKIDISPAIVTVLKNILAHS